MVSTRLPLSSGDTRAGSARLRTTAKLRRKRVVVVRLERQIGLVDDAVDEVRAGARAAPRARTLGTSSSSARAQEQDRGVALDALAHVGPQDLDRHLACRRGGARGGPAPRWPRPPAHSARRSDPRAAAQLCVDDAPRARHGNAGRRSCSPRSSSMSSGSKRSGRVLMTCAELDERRAQPLHDRAQAPPP